jgi:hypothetical protein
MKSLAIRCRLCGNDNLFPLKYAGRTLSCSHCGESLPVSRSEASPVLAMSATRPSETHLRETGLRRLTKAICFGLCMLCFLVLGGLGGGWAGLQLAFRLGFLGYILSWVTCPAGGLIGLWLTRWLGQGIARLMSSYRLTFPGLLLGMAGGVLYWSQTQASPQAKLMTGQLAVEEWLTLSLVGTTAGLLAGLLAMIVDAITNFTR